MKKTVDEIRIKYALGNKEFFFWQDKKAGNVFISDVGIRSICLSLSLGTAKFKQLDKSPFFNECSKNVLF